MNADPSPSYQQRVVYWKHPGARNTYTAATFDDAFALILRDPKSLIRSLYHFNSLAKWHTADHYDDYIGGLVAYLYERFHEKREEFLSMFNGGTFLFYLVNLTRKQMMSKEGHTRKFGSTGAESIDDENFSLPPSGEIDIDHDEENEVSLELHEPDVIKFILRSPAFNEFAPERIDIYLRWFEQTRTNLKRVPISAFAREHDINEREVRAAISGINRVLRKEINRIKSI